MVLIIVISLKTIQSLQNGLQPHSEVAPMVLVVYNETANASVIAALTLHILTLSVNGRLRGLFLTAPRGHLPFEVKIFLNTK